MSPNYARCFNRDNFVAVPSYVELPWLHGSLPQKSTASVSFWLYMFCKIRWTRVWITAVGIYGVTFSRIKI